VSLFSSPFKSSRGLTTLRSHQNSQRFAVGTVESQIIIYDLRTATKWRVLEGTEGAVSAVAFEKEGERMASYCASEHAVRIWATRSPGLFGNLLTIRGTFLASIQLQKLKDNAPEDIAVLKECRLEWVGPTELRLRRETGILESLQVHHV
jgi:WD40 repeat protein